MAKLDPLEIARMSQLLTEAFGEIERRIILLMVKRLMDGPPELPAEMGTWKAEKLLQSVMLRRESARTIKRMGANIPDYLDRLLYRAWKNGHGLQDMTVYDPDRLGILGSAEAAARRSYMKSKVRENALHELNRVNTSMLRSGQQKYIDILNDATDRVVTRDASPRVAIKEASQKLVDEGLTGFTDRAGRRWQVETATEMIVRKAANDAGNLAVFSHMEEEGVELLLVSAHKGARPLCSLDQGRVFSLKGFEGTVKDGEGNSIRVRSWASSTYGHPAGILGINCRHHIVPFYEGRSINTQERPDDEENAKQYKLEQEQRRRERELRKHKRLRDTANALGDREEELRQKRIIRAKGKKLRGFIDEHGLTRNKLRERNMVSVIPNSDNPIREKIMSGEQNFAVDRNKQAEHLPGYPRRRDGKIVNRWKKVSRDRIAIGRPPNSLLYRSIDLDQLIREGIESGIVFNDNKPIAYAESTKYVGRYYDRDLGKYELTRRFAMYMTEKGVHIFPVKERWKEDEV